MGQKDTFLTTKEFALRSGLAVTQVTKMLREKKLAGEKQSGKWMIPASALTSLGESTSAAPATPWQVDAASLELPYIKHLLRS